MNPVSLNRGTFSIVRSVKFGHEEPGKPAVPVHTGEATEAPKPAPRRSLFARVMSSPTFQWSTLAVFLASFIGGPMLQNKIKAQPINLAQTAVLNAAQTMATIASVDAAVSPASKEALGEVIRNEFGLYMQQVSTTVAAYRNPEEALKAEMGRLPVDQVSKENTLAFYKAAVASGEINQPEMVLTRYIDEQLAPHLNRETAEAMKSELRQFLTERQDFNDFQGNVQIALMLVMLLSFGASMIASKRFPSTPKSA